MAKERGVIVQVWRAFIASLMPKIARAKFVGKDYYGTKYYEDPQSNLKRGRSYIPANPDDFMQEIPAEWESWLRYRRQKPPTAEEINENYKSMMMKKHKAAELDTEYAREMNEKNRNNGKSLEITKETTEFPSYSDYNNHGENYKFQNNKNNEEK